jgi:hypothetical protein
MSDRVIARIAALIIAFLEVQERSNVTTSNVLLVAKKYVDFIEE